MYILRTYHSIGHSTAKIKDLLDTIPSGSAVAIADIHSLTGVAEFILESRSRGLIPSVGMTVNLIENAAFAGELVLLADDLSGYNALKTLLSKVEHAASGVGFSPQNGIAIEDLQKDEFKDILSLLVAVDGYPGSSSALLARKKLVKNAQDLVDLRADNKNPIGVIAHAFRGRQWALVNWHETTLAHTLVIEQGVSHDVSPVILHGQIISSTTMSQHIANQKLYQTHAAEWLNQFPEGKAVPYIKHVYSQQLRTEPPPATDNVYVVNDYDFASQRSSLWDALCSKESKTDRLDLEARSLNSLVKSVWPSFSAKFTEHEKEIYQQRIRDELKTIREQGYENYFLNLITVKELTEQQPGNRVMLRGSAVSSCVMHMLGFSPVDPVEQGLMFERFLSPYRKEEPDADLEFVDNDAIRQQLYTQRPNNNADQMVVAPISDYNHISKGLDVLQAAHDAILDYQPELSQHQRESFGRALKLATQYAYRNGQINTYWQGQKFSDVFDTQLSPLMKRMKAFPEFDYLIDVAKSIHAGVVSTKVSASSVVIAPLGLQSEFDVISATRSGTGHRIPWNSDALKATGHIKYDLLNNYVFTRVQNLIYSLGKSPSFGAEPVNRAISFVFKQQAILSLYQLTSATSESAAIRMSPRNMNEITALFALIREQDDVIDQYLLNRKNGGYEQALGPLVNVLKETHGLLIYEEQLLNILMNVGGLSYTEADGFRSSLKKGKSEVIDLYENRYIEHAKEKFGVSSDEASRWYQPFRDKRGRFVFSKAHSVSYAYLAVQQCYLKCYYPAFHAAELFLDAKFTTAKGDRLAIILADWSKLFANPSTPGSVYAQPQTALDFVDHLATIIHREQEKPTSKYALKNASILTADLPAISEMMWSLQLAPLSMSKQEWDMAFKEKVNEKLSAITLVRSASSPQAQRSMVAPSLSKNTSVVPSKNAESLEQTGSETKFFGASLNGDLRQTPEKIDESAVGLLLAYLTEIGLIHTLTSDKTKAKSDDHFKFVMKSAKDDQALVHYHVCVVSLDPKRTGVKAARASRGLFQSGPRAGTGFTPLTLLAYMAADGVLPGVHWNVQIPQKGNYREWEKVKGSMRAWLLQQFKKNPDTAYPESGEIAAPTLEKPLDTMILTKKPSHQLNAQLNELIGNWRGIYVGALQPDIDAGLLQLGYKYRLITPADERKPPFMKEDVTLVSQFRSVDGVTPLQSIPIGEPNAFASGGHQIYYIADSRDKPGAKKMVKQDHASNGVRGRFYGLPKVGSTYLWITEGVFNQMAFNEINTSMPDLFPDLTWHEPNAISLHDSGSVQNFFEKLLGIKFVSNESKNAKTGQIEHTYDFALYDHTPVQTPLTDLMKLNIRGFFQQGTIHVLVENEYPDLRDKLALLYSSMDQNDKSLDECVVWHYPKSPNEDLRSRLRALYSDKKNCGANQSVIHGAIFDNWLKINSLAIAEHDGTYKVMSESPAPNPPMSAYFSKLPAGKQRELSESIRQKFVSLTGAQGVGIALDDDVSGRGHAGGSVEALCMAVGLPVVSLYAKNFGKGLTYPHPVKPGVNVELTDQNDYLKLLKELYNGQHWDAMKLIAEIYTRSFDPISPAPPRKPEQVYEHPEINNEAELQSHIRRPH